MGRMYTVVMPATAVTVAKDLMRIKSAADKVTVVHEIKVTQETLETSEQLPLLIQRASTDGTGTSKTPEKCDAGDAAFGGTVVVNLSADTTLSGAPLWEEGQNILNGWHYLPPPEARPVIPGQGRLTVRLTAAPGASTTFAIVAVLEEIG